MFENCLTNFRDDCNGDQINKYCVIHLKVRQKIFTLIKNVEIENKTFISLNKKLNCPLVALYCLLRVNNYLNETK